MDKQNLTDEFLQGILEITAHHPTDDIIQKVKFCLLDYIGVTLGGSSVTDVKINKLRGLLGDNNSDALVIGEPFKLSLQNAIFFNGLNSHVLELDDGCRYGVTHPGGPLFSALLPVAFKYSVGWKEFVYGVLTGYETILRISTSIQPSHYNKGYHPTATCTPLGIAVGLSVMLGLPYQTIKDAFSCACISAGGSLKAIENTSKLKVFNAAKAAELGFASYCMATAGFTGPEDVLSGKTGFLNIMASDYKEGTLIRKPNEPLWVSRVYCKLYASCRHTHGAIEAILKLRQVADINEVLIKKIEVKIYRGIKGKHDIYDIYGEESAKMSIPYTTAATYVYGNANDEIFNEECITNPRVRNLMELITITEDPHLTSLLPDKRATEVVVSLQDGRNFSEIVYYPKGEPENPVGFEDLLQKFSYLIKKAGITKNDAHKIIEIIFGECPNLTRLSYILNELNK